MNNKRIIPIVLVSVSIILFTVAIVLILNTKEFTLKHNTDNQETNQSQIKEDNNKNNETENTNTNTNTNNNQSTNTNNTQNNSNNEQTSNQNNQTTEPTNNNVADKKEDTNQNQPVNNNTENKEEVVTKSETNLISYFQQQDNMITSNTNQDDSSFREKAKNAFITIVDFIFYDKEIKGYTFNELTTLAKLKVIEIALSINNKIDEYFRDYKDVIKDKYENIKGKLAVKYLEFTSTLCEKVGEDACNQAKEDFNTLKENFSITWQLIKELASNGSKKVKEFYESWRDS